jgi:hypothetical protein
VASGERDLGEFGGDPGLCRRIRLWELPDQYVLEPTDGASPSQCLAISRVNGDITALGEREACALWPLLCDSILGFGVLLLLQLPQFLAQVMCQVRARISVCIRR